MLNITKFSDILSFSLKHGSQKFYVTQWIKFYFRERSMDSGSLNHVSCLLLRIIRKFLQILKASLFFQIPKNFGKFGLCFRYIDFNCRFLRKSLQILKANFFIKCRQNITNLGHILSFFAEHMFWHCSLVSRFPLNMPPNITKCF